VRLSDAASGSLCCLPTGGEVGAARRVTRVDPKGHHRRRSELRRSKRRGRLRASTLENSVAAFERPGHETLACVVSASRSGSATSHLTTTLASTTSVTVGRPRTPVACIRTDRRCVNSGFWQHRPKPPAVSQRAGEAT